MVEDEGAQARTFAELERRCDERIDTHAASVFLIGDRAYKVKRAVRFSYLDFSTRQKREAACRAEVVLNRRTAPDLYLGVETICGEPVVVMRRFDQHLLFDRLAEEGKLDDALMEHLSAEIVRFHAGAEITPGRGGRASLEIEIAGNEENLKAAPPDAFPSQSWAALVERWRAALERHARLLDRRDRLGKVRRCHGDLHLRNICLWQGRPTLFDCIEFNEHLTCIDVLYDLAFLLMDLVHRNLDRFANVVFNAYLDRSDETEGLAALPLMMSLRAAIRAHTGLAAARAQSHPERRAAMIEGSRRYLSLAEHLLHGRPPRLIAVGGLIGTGKSTLARGLAPRIGTAPGARLLHTDAMRKAMFGVEATARLSQDAYSRDVTARVYQAQRERAAASLRAGQNVIVDGVFANPSEREAIRGVARACGAGFVGLWLVAPDDVLRRRVERRTGDMSDATTEILEAQLKWHPDGGDWIRVDASRDPATALEDARGALVHAVDSYDE